MQTPTLIFCGERDEVEKARCAAELMPNATFISLAGLDHLGVVRRSDLILPHIRAFLQRVAGLTATGA